MSRGLRAWSMLHDPRSSEVSILQRMGPGKFPENHEVGVSWEDPDGWEHKGQQAVGDKISICMGISKDLFVPTEEVLVARLSLRQTSWPATGQGMEGVKSAVQWPAVLKLYHPSLVDTGCWPWVDTQHSWLPSKLLPFLPSWQELAFATALSCGLWWNKRF